MNNLTDRDFLLGQQYVDAGNLGARASLHQRFSTNPQGVVPWFFERLELPPQARVLEVGAGPGGYWAELAGDIPAGWDITVTDFSPGMVAQAREGLRDLDHAFTVLQADIQELPFPDAAFDAVIANFMLYHVPDRPRAFAHVRRVLAGGGHLYALTNGAGHMREINDLVRRVAPHATNFEAPGFSLENGGEQLARHFDRVEMVRYPDSLRVTEVEPLLAYVRSGLADLTAGQLQALREAIEIEVHRPGGFQITKDSGLFKAVKL